MVDQTRKQVPVLVIGCCDHRFHQGVTRQMMAEYGQFDLICLAGASYPLVGDNEAVRHYALGMIRLLCEKHWVNTVIIVDHCDCAAYGGETVHPTKEAEIGAHKGWLLQAEAVIREQLPDLRLKVMLYVLDFNKKWIEVKPDVATVEAALAEHAHTHGTMASLGAE